MNTLIFLGGAGLGSLVSIILILLAVSFLRRESDAAEKKRVANSDEHLALNRRIVEINALSVEALRDRNSIGERQAKALETIAGIMEHDSHTHVIK